jgi:hypothetical protein
MIRAFQWDLARQVERLDWLLAQLPRYADWGYQELYLHLEDAIDYPSLPGVGRADAYSWREFEQLVAAARRHGIGVVPIVNLLGHTQYLIKAPEWRDLNELRAPDGSALESGQICPLHPRTAEVAARLFRDVTPYCTAGKIHVGLDESFHLGKHPLSRAEVAEVGLATHFSRYVHRLHALATQHQLRFGMWADMLAFLPDAIPELPRDLIAYDWYYHAFRRHPRVELHNFAEVDLATPLRAQGIEYWGCPMNGAFRFEPLPVFGERLANAQAWWRRCHQVGAGGFLVTSWEPYRLAMELTTVVDAAIASLWLDSPTPDHLEALTKGFARVFGPTRARDAARTALAGDDSAFAGYARWEMNERWDGMPTDGGLARAAAEARLHGRLALRPGLPAPLQASLGFRRYLAERDVFVRRAAKGVWKLRRLVARPDGPVRASRDDDAYADHLARLTAEATAFSAALSEGRRMAQRMWRRTRSASPAGANQRILAADRARLTAWRQWLARAARNRAHVWTASPVAGAWQLQFTVINFAPAAQRVVVEQAQADGTWREIGGRYTIEFRTLAARPRANLRRRLVIPVAEPNQSLRIGVRGVGCVGIAQVVLTNGVTQQAALRPRESRRVILGSPAPASGWPVSPPSSPGWLPLRFRSV